MTRNRNTAVAFVVALCGATTSRGDGEAHLKIGDPSKKGKVTIVAANSSHGWLDHCDVEIPEPCDAREKARLIKEQCKEFTIDWDGDDRLRIGNLKDNVTWIIFYPGDTEEGIDKAGIEVLTTEEKEGGIEFKSAHFEPFDHLGQPAFFTAGIVTDVGELTVRISSQELNFQTEGPIICQALFQRLAPQASQFGAQINYAGDRLEVYFDPAYTTQQAYVVFGTTSPTPGCSGAIRVPHFWQDDFDAYATGSELIGQGGWEGWDNNPSVGALISAEHALSSPNAAAIVGDTDLVHQFGAPGPGSGATTGKWIASGWLYVPSPFTSNCVDDDCGSYFILLNTYDHGGPYHWSVQLHADSITNSFIRDGVTPASLPLLTDMWVEVKVAIDLDADSYRVFYNSQELGTAESWTAGVFGQGGGALEIAALDLFANGSSVVYWDDLVLTEDHGAVLTHGDLNCDGLVNFGDINPFVLALSNPDGYAQQFPDCDIDLADINGDGEVNFGDINPFVQLLAEL